MDKFPLTSEDISISKSNANASKNICEANDSVLMNQSMIISGNVNTANREVHDISNNYYTSDELNTNIDALMPEKKAIFLEEKSDVDTLNENPLKSHCMGESTLPLPCNKSDVYKSKSLSAVEVPDVEITSREESNGKFRVKLHIKGFRKI